jgi:two-component system, chemotaxis family, CheB/CheR fusion protein
MRAWFPKRIWLGQIRRRLSATILGKRTTIAHGRRHPLRDVPHARALPQPGEANARSHRPYSAGKCRRQLQMPTDKNSAEGTVNPEAPAPMASAPDFPVVGIGASAGGIQALLQFFERMPHDAGMAFVIVLHLSPQYESRADEILQRVTKMPVSQVTETTRIEQNRVYLISPSSNLAMIDGALHVAQAERPYGRPIAIDLFFRTLAEVHGTRAISVILSGTGSDGAVGISRVKECAGITIAQSPDDAEYDEMPRSALATGLVDITLPVADIPHKLVELWNNARVIRLPLVEGDEIPGAMPESERTALRAEQALHDILTTLHVRTGHDFHHYKRATVLRRIERRLQVNAVADLPSYQRFFDSHPDETPALLKDMLIGVTNFFRDRDAFEALEREVIPRLFEDKQPDEQVRAWVAGCSTGEEVYSLGMLLCEHAALDHSSAGIQLFATDIDDRAIEIARLGTFPESILTDVPPTRLRNFFTKVRGRYVVSKALREIALFATHNVLRDPPFSRLDLVSCRNLLIYLDRTVQRQILQTFHFALQPGGYLFLGNAESAEVAEDLFVPVDKKNRIYRVKTLVGRMRRALSAPVTGRVFHPGQLSIVKPEVPHARPSPASLHQRVRERHAPPSVMVDHDGEILHMSEEVAPFLRYVGGEPTHNLLTLINPDLRVEVRTALFQVLHQGQDINLRHVRFTRGDTNAYVDIAVRSSRDNEGTDIVLVSFDELEETTPRDEAQQDDANRSAVVLQLEQELQRAKEQLLLSIEQSSVSHEELKASNEELQAIVEELRSASEELETSKEELQSVNEELTTVNSELEQKVAETDKAKDDLENLIVSTGIATIFVDRQMRIKRYTAPAVALFNLIESDIGRSLLDLTHRLNYPELADDASAAFENLKLTEREVSTHQGSWFLARLLPYRTLDDRIDGAVLTLIDITTRRQAEWEARASEDRLKLAALATDDYGIIVHDLDGMIVNWNRGAVRVFGYEESEVVGQNVELIFVAADRADGVPLAERQRAASVGRAEDERWHVRKDGTEIYCSGVTTPIDSNTFRGYAKIVRDVTDRKGAESQQQLQLSLERAVRGQAEAANRLKDEFFAVLSHELKNPLNLIHVKAELLLRAPEVSGIALVREAADAIQRSVVGQAKIIDDLLDLSRVRTGKLALQFAPVDLAAIIRSVADASATDAAVNGVELSLSGVHEPFVIHADAVRFEQMLWNLVRNALKFTPRGGRVGLSLARDDSDGRFALVEVADTGQGIPPQFLPKVFDMFSQADGGGRRNYGGLGIGLSLVKQLAEMHGGRVVVESEGAGLGTRARLWLPESADAAASPRRGEPVGPSILSGLRVLLVDDAIEALEALRVLLEMEGAQVMAVDSGEQALQAAAENDFDLIVSDIGMPTMSGYELMTELRKLSRTANVPAIAITGFGRKQDAAKALRAGFNAHLSKPVPLQSLLDAIGGNLARR